MSVVVLRAVWAYLLSMPVVSAGMLFYILRSRDEDSIPADVTEAGAPVDSVDSELSLAPFIIAAAVVFAMASVLVPPIVHRSEVARVRRGSQETDPIRTNAFSAYLAPFVVSLVLAATSGLFGFMYGFIGFGAPVAYGLMVISALLIAVRFPTEKRILAPFGKGAG
jgi:hypothetical protein